jgi:hypothetical protein
MKWRRGWGDDDVALARDVLDRQLVDTSVRARYRTLASLAAGVLVLVTGIRVASVSDNPAVIGVQWRYYWPAQPITGQLNRSRPITRPQRAAYRHAA